MKKEEKETEDHTLRNPSGEEHTSMKEKNRRVARDVREKPGDYGTMKAKGGESCKQMCMVDHMACAESQES